MDWSAEVKGIMGGFPKPLLSVKNPVLPHGAFWLFHVKPRNQSPGLHLATGDFHGLQDPERLFC
jgi:hypothetical protein